MLFMPTNVYPSTFGGLGDGTIDAAKDLTVSWQVLGNPALMTAFSITIYKNDDSSTQLYTTGRLTDNCPFYGVDYRGDTQFFRHTIDADTLAGAGISNGGDYKLIIRQWWSEDEYTEQVSASAFITRETPSVTIDPVADPLNSRKAEFTATYTQAQGDALMWVRWRIAEDEDRENPLLDTQNIYGTAELKVMYDGFFTGYTYAVRCEIETVNGIQADSGWVSFSVEYETQTVSGYVEVTRPPRTSGLMVAWPSILYIPGSPTGDYDTSGGELELGNGSSVTWDSVTGDPMDIKAPWTLIWKGRTPTGGAVLRIGGAQSDALITIGPDAVSLTYGGETLFEREIDFIHTDRWMVILRQGSISVQHQRYTGGLYPAVDLWPSESLYPKADTILSIKGVYSGQFEDMALDIKSLTLIGPQVCEYLYVQGGTMSDGDVSAAMGELHYEPPVNWAGDTKFYTGFDNGLTAGNITTLGDQVTGFAIYRLAEGESSLAHVADTSLSTKRLVDYGAVSQRNYTYYMFAAGASTYTTAPLTSPLSGGCFWSWTLLECERDDAGVYHVLREYPFRYNVVSGELSNNNAPGLENSFTPYPLIQPMSSNYKSGTLTALIGDTRGGRYSDTVELRDELMALSLTVKHLFLKSRKGDLWKIRITAPVTVSTMDNSAEQVQTISLGWTETESAKGASIVALPTDGAWRFGGGEES